jgi:hypothetical protein
MFRYAPMSRWTVKLALRRTRCRIEDAKAALADICGIWGDFDQGFVNGADERIVELDDWMAEIAESVRERLDAGEEVGP